MAATTRCMNGECATTSAEWRRGWQLRSGGFALLCHKCGMAYEQSIFCDLFHLGESGWRECISCSKRLHCGCIASKHLVELVDKGGVQCFNCTKNSEPSTGPSETIPAFLPQSNHRILSVMARSLENEKSNDDFRVQIGTSNHTEDIFNRGQAIQLSKNIGIYEQNKNILSHRESQSESFAHIKREQLTLYTGQMGNTHSGFDSRDQAKMISAAQQAQRGHHLLARPTKMSPAVSSEASKEAVSQMRVARPPTDGKGRNQLLPRYWPRITDQELQQISGDSNSTVVPLFEKVLSASDAGRIGRLVLPKACAEAYFPPISQPEGIPLKIQDAKGKEWHFQFRFWPNNNSRMYVLEGVTPCIQSLQLQAGDTVTFSRMDPEGKLIMGFRKATNYVSLQDSQISAIANAGLGNDSFFSSSNDNLTLASGGYSGLFQSFKGNADPRQSYLSEHLNLADEDSANVQYHQDRKKTHNIKSKRLHIGNADALDLKVSWEEAQDLLRPSPTAKPSVVRIEDQEFEEYEEPPVFGKRTIFTVQLSGDQDQWIQCDNCFKWRRLPVDVLVPSTWTCNDNTWDPQRSSCSKPDELGPAEIQNLLHQISEMKKQRTSTSCNQGTRGQEESGHDTIANAATSEEPSNQAITTKHPRHRPGCTCIVCIQPPSGKGPKHHTNCTCNVCMTVKRRFKTLMLRKKKRQFEKEEAEAIKKTEGSCSTYMHDDKASEVVPETNSEMAALDDAGKGKIDLNAIVYDDHNAAEASASSKTSMIDLVHVASLPLDNYLKQNGLASLACEEGTPIESEEDCSGDAKSDAS